MLKKVLAGAGLIATIALSACQTVAEPVTLSCRAPSGEEFDFFRAIVSRDRNTILRHTASGPARSAMERRDPYVNQHLWGNQGYTGGTLVGVLTQPPPCVVDMPQRIDTEGNPITTQRSILVYQQARFQQLTGGSVTFAPEEIVRAPGTRGQDYFRCDMVQTSQGWRNTDLCGLPTVRSGVGR
jgi:hypothetical protein